MGCFAVGTQAGFIVYNTDPLKERFRRDCGSVGIIELLFKTNILAFVGGGTKPRYSPRQVMLWDDYQNKVIGELEFRSNVLAVKMKRDRLIITLENKIYAYNFADLTLLFQAETTNNPLGLSCVSLEKHYLACLGLQVGSIHVENFEQRDRYSIVAHNSPIQALTMSSDGSVMATVSTKGTLIRIFDVKSGKKIRELRRGMEQALITNLCFDYSGKHLLVFSDKGTVHLYSVQGENRSSS